MDAIPLGYYLIGVFKRDPRGQDVSFKCVCVRCVFLILLSGCTWTSRDPKDEPPPDLDEHSNVLMVIGLLKLFIIIPLPNALRNSFVLAFVWCLMFGFGLEIRKFGQRKNE